MYKFVEKWYIVPDVMPANGELVYIRLVDNSYNPIYCEFNESSNNFKQFLINNVYSKTQVHQWARLYPTT